MANVEASEVEQTVVIQPHHNNCYWCYRETTGSQSYSVTSVGEH